ncbi:MAG: hypothetical protein H6618_07295 [Deltaproteobacteria bacterium]|nr:hypothetical protein [Deltaproteobacteria bacterium]
MRQKNSSRLVRVCSFLNSVSGSSSFFLFFILLLHLCCSVVVVTEAMALSFLSSHESEAKGCQEWRLGDFRDPRFSDRYPAILASFVRIEAALTARRAESLQPLLHRNLAQEMPDLKQIFKEMSAYLGVAWEISLLRAWSLEGMNLSERGEIRCKGEKIRLFPHYGYARQWFLLFQILGQKELGRVFVSLIPDEDHKRWKVGYFAFRQWTHAGKDPQTWIAEADQSLKTGRQTGAGVRYLLAKNLMAGNRHFIYELHEELDSWLKTALPESVWQLPVRQALAGDDNIEEISSLFAPGGIGLLLKFQLSKTFSGKEVRAHCQERLHHLKSMVWFSDFKGIRCSYFVSGNSTQASYSLGSLYLDRHS